MLPCEAGELSAKRTEGAFAHGPAFAAARKSTSSFAVA
jgi:hypothetical protein